MKNAMCIEDLRRIARRNVPRVFIDYMEAGSYSEHTRDANVEDMAKVKLRQRVLVDVSTRSMATPVATRCKSTHRITCRSTAR